MSKPRKRLAALILGVVLIALTVFVVADRGALGEGSPPGDDGIAEVQGVDDGLVTQQQFDDALARTAEQQGLKKPPAEDDPQYATFSDQALGDALLPLWIKGEAADRGLSVTDTEIADRTQQIVDQNFGSPKEFEDFVREQGFCTDEELEQGEPTECEGVRNEVEVMILAEDLQEDVVPPALAAVASGQPAPQDLLDDISDDEVQSYYDENQEQFQDEKGETPPLEEVEDQVRTAILAAEQIPDADVEDFYEENIEQYEVPETRDVRVIQNQDEAKVEDAIAELEADDSEKSWDAVAKEFSQDPVSKDRGGLLEGVVEGQSPGGPAFDEAVFGASEGEIVGPIETDNGFYAAQVVGITPSETTPLDEVATQIRQQLATEEQTALVTDFEEDFINKWTERTVCDEAIASDRCVNFEAPNPRSCDGTPPLPEDCPQTPDPLACNEELADAQGCPAPAISRKPRAPGGPANSDPLTNLAQGPFPPAQEAAAGALPGGALPGGIPGGAVPPTGAPPTGAPPTGTPPTGAPPTGAPPTGAPPTGAPPTGGAPVPPGG
jgi:parvulin-like peptidyl-prolyl isomerase